LLANEGSSAKLIVDDGVLRIETTRLKRKKPYDVRLERTVAAKKGKGWRVRFQVRSDRSRTLVCRLMQGAAPWRQLSKEQLFPASTNWSHHDLLLFADADEPDARIQFLAGDAEGFVELKDVSLEPVDSPASPAP
jgi:hypothetical protein